MTLQQTTQEMNISYNAMARDRLLILANNRRNSPLMQKVRSLFESEKGAKTTFYFRADAFDNFSLISTIADVLEKCDVIEEVSALDEGWITGEITFTRR